MSPQPTQAVFYDGFSDFSDALDRRGIEAWAVVGDPDAIKPENQDANAQRIADLTAAYGDMIAGIQIDNEPWTSDHYDSGSSGVPSWTDDYVDALQKNAAASSMPLEVVVPYWLFSSGADPFDGSVRSDNALAFLDSARPYADSFSVLAFRVADDADQALRRTYDASTPTLTWGDSRGERVHIAVEVEPGDPYYYAEDAGYAVVRDHLRDLHGDPDGVLANLSPPTSRPSLDSFDGFQGFAIHGLEDRLFQ